MDVSSLKESTTTRSKAETTVCLSNSLPTLKHGSGASSPIPIPKKKKKRILSNQNVYYNTQAVTFIVYS